MARPVWGAWVALLLLGIPRPGNPQELSPQGDAAGAPEILYGGPTALYDPADPLYSVRWTLGLTLPSRTLLSILRRPATRKSDFDMDRGKVIETYQAGDEDILPPMAYTPEEYGRVIFSRRLKDGWIDAFQNAIAESQARKERQQGIGFAVPIRLGVAEKLFGEGLPNLRVSGSEQITISGSSYWVPGQVTGERGGNSLFPKLDMRQQLNVNLQGTIGSKLFVDVAQNSEALTPLENSMKIRYKGDEDEVVKSVELGNTTLSLPPSQFVSYSSQQAGLFGVKTQAQVGNLDFTAIASRQEGQSGQATFTGGSSVRTVYIKDINYIVGKYFFLADPDSDIVPTGNINLRLYLDDKRADNNIADGAVPARVWLDPGARTPTEPATGNFHLLVEQQDYTLNVSETNTLPTITLLNPLLPVQTLAAAYSWVNSSGQTVQVGDFQPAAGDTVLNLKMIRPGTDDWNNTDLTKSKWAPVRRLEMRNVYSLGGKDIDMSSFDLRIVRDVAGDGGNNPFTITNEFGVTTPLIQLLGLDQKNNANPSDRTPDGKVDPEYIIPSDGLLIFPDLRPFDPSLADIQGGVGRERSWPRAPGASRPDTLGWNRDPGTGAPVPSSAAIRNQETVPQIYDLSSNELSVTGAEHHLYTIEATLRSAVSTIQLNAFGGILEGSETVTLNNRELSRGTDYQIDYQTGQVILKTPDATAPNADLRINYSYDSPFSQGNQSLVGGTVATHPDPNATLQFSTSWLHESHGSADRRPRIGQEPTRTTVGGSSAKLQLTPWFLTDLVDKIPLVHTNAPSRLEMTGALGISLPNPNTRGEVYVDDMEGTETDNSPPLDRLGWFWSSIPAQAVDSLGVDHVLGAADRGELLWFNPNTVQVKDITPREDNANEANNTVQSLEVVYAPPTGGDPQNAWGGLVTPMAGSQGIDLSRSEYLELWVNDYIPIDRASERRGEILVDIGRVSEDAVWDPLSPPDPPNGQLDVEDVNTDRQVQVSEDVGLDKRTSTGREGVPVEEARPAGKTDGFGAFSATQDPAGDDRPETVPADLNAPEKTLDERIAKYRGINGTEANQHADGEDLDGDDYLSVSNDYYEYKVDLKSAALIDVSRDFGVTDPRNGWRFYRIPLAKPLLTQGSPTLTQVKHMRVWFRGVDPGDTLDVQFASISVVGNRWERSDSTLTASDEVLKVAVVNNKETPGYIPPFQVRRVNDVEEKEQSLSLEFQNFRPGNQLTSFSRLASTYDYTAYQTVAYYLNPRLQSAGGDSVEFFLRFGSNAATDTLDYYEVSTVLSATDPRRRGDGWLDIHFNVADISSIKLRSSTAVGPGDYLAGPGDAPADSTGSPRVDIGHGLKVTVRGNPSLSRVKRLSAGIRNVSPDVLPQGSVWFDEFRMGDVRRDKGWATQGTVSLTLADLAALQGSVNLTSADFLRLGQDKGSGTENLQYDLRGQVALHKFMEPLRLNAPLGFTLSRARQTPKFVPNEDILYQGQTAGREISRSESQSATLSLSREPRGLSNPFIRYTVDALRLNGSYQENRHDGITQTDHSVSASGNASYNLSFAYLRPLRFFRRFSLSPWPRSLTAALSKARSSTSVSAPDPADPTQLKALPTTVTKTGNLNLGASVQPIGGLTYTVGTSRDLVDEHFGPDSSVVRLQRPADRFLGVNLGREVQQTHNVNFNYTPPFFGRTLSPRFSWTGSSTQNRQPSLTLEDYTHAVFDISNTNQGSISFSIPVSRWMQKLTGQPDQGGFHPPPRGGQRPARPDTTRGGSGREGDFKLLFTKVIKLKDIQTTGSLGKQSSYSRLYGSPPLDYRLGLTRDIGYGASVYPEEKAAANRSLGQTSSIRGNTAVTFLNTLDINFNYEKRHSLSQTNSLVGRTTDDTTWPDIRFDWGDIQKRIPFLGRLMPDFRAVNTQYTRQTRVTGTEDDPNEETTVTTSWRPLLSVQGTLPGRWRTTANVNLTSSNLVSDRVGGAATSSQRSNVSYQLSFNKRFTPKVQGKGRDVDFKLDMSYSRDSSTNSSSGYGQVQKDTTDKLRVAGSTGLKLTSAMSGTFGLEFNQDRRPTTNWTRRSIRIYFSTGFSF